jgi:hypothetical protein
MTDTTIPPAFDIEDKKQMVGWEPRSRARWSDMDVALVREHYAKMSAADLGKMINRSPVAIANLASRLGLKKTKAERGDTISHGRLRLKKDKAALVEAMKEARRFLFDQDHFSAIRVLELAITAYE